MEIYEKLHEARKYIKAYGKEKQGRNDYSKYDYFTPEQISQMVFEACEANKLIPLFSLRRNELGLYGELKIVDFEKITDNIIFEMVTDIPSIKATNVTQQIGGAVTYTERYLLMTAFDIKDNNLDPDSTQNTQDNVKENAKHSSEGDGTVTKQWLNKWCDKEKSAVLPDYLRIVKKAKEKGMEAKDLFEHYMISKDILIELKKDLS